MINKLYLRHYDYPFADRVNSRLYNIIKERDDNDPIRLGGARRTNIDLHKKEIKEVDNIIRWVNDLIPDFSSDIVGGRTGYDSKKVGGSGGFDLYDYQVDSCWGIIYNKGHRVIKHNHFPYTFSFCYYVNTPSHSSPLIIEGKRMKMREGQLIIFLSHYNHWVPESKVDGRCVLVGNINYN